MKSCTRIGSGKILTKLLHSGGQIILGKLSGLHIGHQILEHGAELRILLSDLHEILASDGDLFTIELVQPIDPDHTRPKMLTPLGGQVAFAIQFFGLAGGHAGR